MHHEKYVKKYISLRFEAMLNIKKDFDNCLFLQTNNFKEL
jgi:hypothetical protein